MHEVDVQYTSDASESSYQSDDDSDLVFIDIAGACGENGLLLFAPEDGFQVHGGTLTGQDLLPDITLSADSFIDLVNAISTKIQQKIGHGQFLRFARVGKQPQTNHVALTKSRADIVSAFDDAWTTPYSKVPWPAMESAGEVASEGTSRAEQGRKGLVYVHFLLQARPDRHIVQGFFVDDTEVVLNFAISGVGFRILRLPWSCPQLLDMLYRFIFRLYKPGHFADPSCQRDKGKLTYTLSIHRKPDDALVELEEKHSGYELIYASAPFNTRTNIFLNDTATEIPVFKDQYSREGTAKHEYDMLELVHKEARMVGVVWPVHHEMLTIPAPVREKREKSRLAMRQRGYTFMKIRTPGLALRVLRRKILHCDLSTGNICFLESLMDVPEDPFTEDVCFCGYLLGDDKCDTPLHTRTLIIDLNRAEIAGSKSKDGPHTGTPIFTARAIEKGEPLELTYQDGVILSGTFYPSPTAPHIYNEQHEKRSTDFPEIPRAAVTKKFGTAKAGTDWDRTLYHEAESIFWILVYWALHVQPDGRNDHPLTNSQWEQLHGDWEVRDGLVASYAKSPNAVRRQLHPTFAPLGDLIHRLACLLKEDYYWVDQGSVRAHAEYVHESFQRLILGFLLENKTADFMNTQASTTFRDPEVATRKAQLSPTGPTSQSQKKTSRSSLNSSKKSKSSKTKTKTQTKDSWCVFVLISELRPRPHSMTDFLDK
ncbi:hypothetical protein ONZ45_g17007 [Pleurotus djamor]|nr:hypothetical protein ONZ45_g17007 [Pleurotus djamor]